jgi:hypothetical protein
MISAIPEGDWPDFLTTLDRSVPTVRSLTDPPDDLAFWQTKSFNERLAALGFLCRQAHGFDPVTSRHQRVLTVTELPSG